jgi:hypothetical protein
MGVPVSVDVLMNNGVDDLMIAKDITDRLRAELRCWQERAFLYAPHVVKQAWVEEADGE